jgi:hypothetical protein
MLAVEAQVEAAALITKDRVLLDLHDCSIFARGVA